VHRDGPVGVPLAGAVETDGLLTYTVRIVVHASTLSESCLLRNAWVCPEYVETRSSELADALTEHLVITVISVVIGALVALPLAVLAHRTRRIQPWLVGTTTAIYTLPSLALFSLLLPFTGLSRTTVIIGLVLYSLTILVRNILAGLDGVPDETLDAARGMGFASTRMFWRVELPLALPAMVAGLRVATVSTVALTTVGTIVGNGGLGDLIADGLRTNFKAEVLTASVLCVLLAVVLDAVLLSAQWSLTPWRRTRAAG
jgi:osmoprotectant transport system permease protein